MMDNVCINRCTYTKIKFELEDIVRLYKASREHAGVEKLIQFETYNIRGDGAL